MATSLTIEGLKKMRRWPLWQLEPKPTSKDPLAMTKTPEVDQRISNRRDRPG